MMLNGLIYIRLWLVGAWGLVALAILSFKAGENSQLVHKAVLGSLFLVATLYQLYIGGDAWEYWRFFIPATPLLFILAVSGTDYVGKFIRNKRVSVVLCIALLLGAWYLSNSKFIGELFFTEDVYLAKYNRLNMDYSLILKDVASENTRIAVFWAGTIPYYTGFYSVDFLGKMDPHIARLAPELPNFESWEKRIFTPGHVKYDLDYSVGTYNPDIIQNNRWNNFILDGKYSDNFDHIEFGDLFFFFKKGSMNIDWEKVTALR